MLEAARAHPADHFVGFELRLKRLVKAAQKYRRAALQNAWLLREYAENFARYFPDRSLDGVFIHFPDPWPKRAHWKKRLVQPALLQAIHRKLKAHGVLQLKTDQSGYFLHALDVLAACPRLWQPVLCSNDLRRYGHPVFAVESEFEGLFKKRQRPIFCLQLVAREVSAESESSASEVSAESLVS